MNFKDYLITQVEQFDQKLNEYYVQWHQQAQSIHPKLVPLIDLCIEANKGGKRLRAILIGAGYQLLKNDYPDTILELGASYEVFQTAILNHDDIIDQSLTRRGRPTLYKALGGDHYGISQAITLGDIGYFEALIIVTKIKVDFEIKDKILQHYVKLMATTGIGELLDVELSSQKGAPLESEALQIFKYKTATYSISGPMQLGAILAGASDTLLQSIDQFGENLGIAFQIQDDILGVFGDEKTLGKSVTSDIEEGKNTTLITKANEKATPEQLQILEKYYGTGPITKDQLEQVKQVFIDTGALDYSRQLAVQYVNQAKKVIPELTEKPEMRDLLDQMADFLVKRDK